MSLALLLHATWSWSVLYRPTHGDKHDSDFTSNNDVRNSVNSADGYGLVEVITRMHVPYFNLSTHAKYTPYSSY